MNFNFTNSVVNSTFETHYARSNKLTIVLPKLTLALSCVILHGIGLYALTKRYTSTRACNRPQMLCIISMSFGELVYCVIYSLLTLLKLYASNHRHVFYVLIEQIEHEYLATIYFLNMLFITVERLAKVSLSLRYPLYWNAARTKTLLVATWIIVAILMLLDCLLNNINQRVSYIFFYSQFIYPVLDISFIVIAAFTYCVIIYKWKKNSQIYRRNFKSSVFIVPSLIIASYVVFVIVPDTINVYQNVANLELLKDPFKKEHSKRFVSSCSFSYFLSFLFDGLIYIFWTRQVRRFVSSRFKVRKVFQSKMRRMSDFVMRGKGEIKMKEEDEK